MPCSTLLATFLVRSDAPSVEITVSLSMALIGSLAALTRSGRIGVSRSIIAASP